MVQYEDQTASSDARRRRFARPDLRWFAGFVPRPCESFSPWKDLTVDKLGAQWPLGRSSAYRRRGRTAITGVPPFFIVMPRREPSYHVAVDCHTPSFYYLRPCHDVCHPPHAPVNFLPSGRQHNLVELDTTDDENYKLSPTPAPQGHHPPSHCESLAIVRQSSRILNSPQISSPPSCKHLAVASHPQVSPCPLLPRLSTLIAL